MQVVSPALGFQYGCAVGRNGHLLAGKAANLGSVKLVDSHFEAARHRPVGLVFHLALNADSCLPALYVVVFGIDVHAGGLQVAVERQRLVDVVNHMKPHILGKSAVI